MKKGIHFLFGIKNEVKDFRAVIDRFAAVGFDFVEIPPEPFLIDKGELITELAAYGREKGIELTFSCGFSREYDMASEEEKVRMQGASHLKRILEVMEKADIRLLGGTAYTCWPSKRNQPLELEEKQRILVRTAGIFSKCVQGIKSTGIEIAIEPLNRFEGFLVNTAKEGAALCDLIGNKNVGLMLDGFHMSMEEDSIQGAVYDAGAHLKHLHLAENNRKLPGMGEFPWKTFFEALQKIGYQGRLSIESFMTPEGAVAADVALWRDLGLPADVREQDALLKNSLEFIKTMSVRL